MDKKEDLTALQAFDYINTDTPRSVIGKSGLVWNPWNNNKSLLDFINDAPFRLADDPKPKQPRCNWNRPWEAPPEQPSTKEEPHDDLAKTLEALFPDSPFSGRFLAGRIRSEIAKGITTHRGQQDHFTRDEIVDEARKIAKEEFSNKIVEIQICRGLRSDMRTIAREEIRQHLTNWHACAEGKKS